MLLPRRSPEAAARLVLLLSVLGIAGAQEGSGQAWLQPEGHAYVKLSNGRSAASEQYGADGAIRPYVDGVDGDAFYDRSFYLYGEYGLTDNLTLVGLLPYKRLTVKDAAGETFETQEVGSVILSLRTNIKRLAGLRGDRHTLAANVALSLPAGYTRNVAPSVGPGQVDLQTTINYGVSLYPFPGYAQAGLGYRYRSALYAFSAATSCEDRATDCVADARPKYDDELLFSAEFGVSLDRWALVQLLGQGVWSNQPPKEGFDPRNPLPTRQRYLKAGGGLTLYPIRRLGLSVQYFFTPSGRNTVRSSDLFLGIEYRL